MNKYIFFLAINALSFGSYGQDVIDDSLYSDSAYYANLSHYIPYKTDTSWTFLSLTTKKVDRRFSFDEFCPSNNEDVTNYIFKNDGYYGALNEEGDTLLPFEFDSIISFGYDLISVQKTDWRYHSYQGIIEMNADSIFFDYPFIYTYRSSKIGLMFQEKIILPPVYEAIRPWDCLQFANDRTALFLAHDGSHYNVFNGDGVSLIDEPIDEIQCFEHSLIKYYSGNWKYYSINEDKVIDPKGNDIIFYDALDYKIYNHNRTKSTLYLNSIGRQFSGSYDDYFVVSEQYIAVRKNGRIGLINKKTRAQILTPQFDKLEHLKGNFLKYFVGDSCGLMNTSGKRFFKAEYANILMTANPNRFIVLRQNKTGVVDLNGKVIVPLKYDFIHLEDNRFIFHHNDKYGMADLDGEIKIPVNYSNYRRYEEVNSIGTKRVNYIFDKGQINHFLANLNGILSPTSFSHYTFGNGVIKMYTGKDLIVAILNDEGGILESQTYPSVSAITVKERALIRRSSRTAWPISYLEENQLNGKYGLRFYTQTGMGVSPLYNHIQLGIFSNYYGELESESQKHKISSTIELNTNFIYDGMILSSGMHWNKSLLMSEAITDDFGSNSSVLCVTKSSDGSSGFETQNDDTPLTVSELIATPILYTDRINSFIKRIYMGGCIAICHIDSADISLFSYYHYLNSLGAFSMPKSLISTIMNPKLGVRFAESKKRICGYDDNNLFETNLYHKNFSPPITYSEFEMLPGSNFFLEQKINEPSFFEINEFETEKGTPLFSKKQLLHARALSGTEGYYIETTEPGRRQEKIHINYPNYSFYPTETKLSYDAGRIIGYKDSIYNLSSPKKVIVKDAMFIKYLGEEMFGILDKTGWYIINRDGLRSSKQFYTSVSSFSNGQIMVVQNNSNLIIDKSGKIIAQGNGTIEYFKEDKFIISRTPNMVLFDSKTQTVDTLEKKEKYLGNQFIYHSLGNGKYNVRIFGLKTSLVINSKPKLVNNFVAYSMGKSNYIINQELQVSKFKKTSSIDVVSDSIAIFRAKKIIYYVNENGSQIYSSKTDVKYFRKESSVIIVDGDTSYVLSNRGEISEYSTAPEEKIKLDQESKYSIFYENNKYGVRLDGNIIIPAVHRLITKINAEEYLVQRNTYRTLHTIDMKPITTMDYDKAWLLNGNAILLLSDDHYFYYDEMNEQIIDVE